MLKSVQYSVGKWLIIGLALLWGASVIGAQELAPEEELADLLGNLHAFAAEFDQVSFDGDDQSIQEVQGNMMVQRPGKLYWHTAEPLEQLVISDGQQLWVYDPDLAQVIVQALDSNLTQTPVLLLSGEIETLKSAFDITIVPSERGDRVFELTPLHAESLFERLTLYFRNRSLFQMEMTDSLGQRSRISFHNTQENPVISAEQFTFTPPPGVDVLRDQ